MNTTEDIKEAIGWWSRRRGRRAAEDRGRMRLEGEGKQKVNDEG